MKLVSTDANKIGVFPGVLFRCPFPGQSFDCCRFPIQELLPLAAHGFEQFWIPKRIAEDKILLVDSCGWGFATRTRRSTTSTQTDPSMTSTSQICHTAPMIVAKIIGGRSWMGDWSVSAPRVKSPCTHLLDQEWNRERAVVVVSIKYDRLPMKLFQVFIPGKVDEYKDADLLVVRKDCRHFRIETHRGNPTYEKAIAIEVTMMYIT